MDREQYESPHARALGEALNRGHLTRRDFIRRATLLGLSSSAIAAFLAACGGGNATTAPTVGTTGGGAATTAPTAAATTAATTAAGTASSPTTMAGASPTTMAGASPTTMAGASPTRAGSPTGSPTGGTTYTMSNPPAVANAAEAKKYSGAKLTYYADPSGIGNELDKALAGKFTQETGIQVNVVGKPTSATENYATYQRFFQAQSPDLDVMMIDVIWPAAFAQHLVDLTPKLGDQAKKCYPSIIQNNTINGKLVGFPFFGDFGMLFYRTDLLQKYGFSAPPKTWDELEQMAKKIVDGEKGSNPNLAGFVFQGNAYEGLTCDSLEWLASTGGGRFIENGKVTLNNPQAVAILNKAKGWVGTIAPKGVTSYQEDETAQAFTGGNAAFARNWPYMYALAQSSDKTKGMFDVAPLPTNGTIKPVGTLGGWQLGVSKYSKSVDAAIEFVRYMTSEEAVKFRATVGTYVPLYPSVAEDPEVIRAQPYLKNLAGVERITRPSRELGTNYNQGSTFIFQGINAVLNGQDAQSQLQQIESQLQRLVQRS